MDYTLAIRTDILHDDDGNSHIVYGVDVTDHYGRVISFPDISFDETVVSQLIRVCMQDNVSLCHLPYIIEDTILGQYLP